MAERFRQFTIKFLCDENTVMPMAVRVLDAYKICKGYIQKCNLEEVVKKDCLVELYNNFEDYYFDSDTNEFGVDGVVTAVESKFDMFIDFSDKI